MAYNLMYHFSGLALQIWSLCPPNALCGVISQPPTDSGWVSPDLTVLELKSIRTAPSVPVMVYYRVAP